MLEMGSARNVPCVSSKLGLQEPVFQTQTSITRRKQKRGWGGRCGYCIAYISGRSGPEKAHSDGLLGGFCNTRLDFVPWTESTCPWWDLAAFLLMVGQVSFSIRYNFASASIAGFVVRTSRMAQEIVPAFTLFRSQSVTKTGAGEKAENSNH